MPHPTVVSPPVPASPARIAQELDRLLAGATVSIAVGSEVHRVQVREVFLNSRDELTLFGFVEAVGLQAFPVAAIDVLEVVAPEVTR